jgi:hypothetical protein
VRLAARRFPGIDVPWLARLGPWMPFAIRLHLAVSLLGLLSMGTGRPSTSDASRAIPRRARSSRIGHLPTYGTMLALLVHGSDPELRPRLSTLWPFGGSGAREAHRGPRLRPVGTIAEVLPPKG